MKTYKEHGIILHTVKYGDSSLVVYMLTKGAGRQTYMVQGVKSSKGKGNKAALFQPMFLVEFEGYETPHAQMHRLKDTRALFPLSTIPFDIRKSTISLFMAEVLYRLIREIEPNSPLFDFVCRAVVALDTVDDGVSNFHLWFLVRLSSFLGFYPGNEYCEGWWFDITEGLFVSHEPSHRMSLSPVNANLLDAMMGCEVEGLGDLRLSRERRSGFMSGILTYFGYHFDSIHNIKSIEILREVF